MAKQNMNACIDFTLKYEGGYVNNPKDPGGPTNFGITLATARKFWKKDATATDVKNMTREQAVEIYKNKYWKTNYYDCDTLAPGVDLVVYDMGVHSGPARSKKFLLDAIGGPDTETIVKMCDARLKWLQTLNTWPTFKNGWTTRVKAVKTKALSMNKGYDTKTVSTAATAAIGLTLTSLLWDYTLPVIGAVVVAGAIGYGGWKLYKYLKKKNVV